MKLYKRSPKLWMFVILAAILVAAVGPGIINHLFNPSDRDWNWILLIADIVASFCLVLFGFMLGNVIWTKMQKSQEIQRSHRILRSNFYEINRLAHVCEDLREKVYQNPDESDHRDEELLQTRDMMKPFSSSLSFNLPEYDPQETRETGINKCRLEVIDLINQLTSIKQVRGENENLRSLLLKLIRSTEEGMRLTA